MASRPTPTGISRMHRDPATPDESGDSIVAVIRNARWSTSAAACPARSGHGTRVADDTTSGSRIRFSGSAAGPATSVPALSFSAGTSAAHGRVGRAFERRTWYPRGDVTGHWILPGAWRDDRSLLGGVTSKVLGTTPDPDPGPVPAHGANGNYRICFSARSLVGPLFLSTGASARAHGYLFRLCPRSDTAGP